MEVWVEFTGIARAITGTSHATLSMANGSNCADLIKTLAHDYPGLVNVIINSEGTELLNANVFALNNETMILPDQMSQTLQDGDHLTLLSVIVGGNVM